MSVPVPGALLPSLEGRRLLMVSNRLPITIKKSESGDYTFSESSGGLVTGLKGLKQTTEFLWYGWPGQTLPRDDLDHIRNKLMTEHKAVPVLMDARTADRHYNGFTSKCGCVTWLLSDYQILSCGRFSIAARVT